MNDWQAKVWGVVEEFRARHLQGELARLSVDMFSLAELELRLDVIPFDDLFARFEVDAAIHKTIADAPLCFKELQGGRSFSCKCAQTSNQDTTWLR